MTSTFQKSRQKILFASCAVFALSAAQSAFAQTEQSAGIETVVVTAEKRSQNIQNVPAGVSAVSSETLASMHATQLTDIGSYVPSLQVNSAGTPGQTMISIRGIAPVGPGATVATYIDDVPVGSTSAYGGGIAFALDLLPYDVEQLEVLRGPQGTLYGASSMGGLLKYVLTEPSLDSVEIKVGADVFGVSGAGDIGGGARATLSAPLVDGELGFTASYAYEKTPGFVDNFVTGQKDENGFNQQSARLGFLWQPNGNLTFKLNAMYQSVDADGDGNVVLDPTTLRPLGGWLKDDNLVAQPFHKDIQFYSLSMDYAMGWADLISASSYQKTSTSQTQDDSYQYGVAFPYFGLPFTGLSQSLYKLNLEKYTQEVRLQSPQGSALEWLAGAFFDDEDSSNFQSPSALTPAGVPIPGINPIYVANLPSTYTEYALFGDLTYHLTDAFKVFGGLRYSYNDQTFSEIASSAILGSVDLLNQKSNEGVTTFNAGAQYNLSDHSMAYVRVASGYQPGGPNLAIPGVPSTFKSDTLTNYEAGLKSQLFDDRLLLDADAFYINWKDIQLLSNGAGVSYGANGGTAKSQGFEANASFEAFDGLVIDGTFSYIDAVLTQDVPLLGGLDGDRLPNIPRYSGSLRAEYTRPLSGEWALTLGGGLRFVGSRYSDVNHAADARPIPQYTALDLNAGVSNDRYTVRLFVKNVTSSHGYLTYTPQFNQATGAMTQIEAAILQPRTIGLSLDAKF
ncbi:MAG: TonB-dependent receptor [Rhizomicrobium sp.]